MKAGALGDEMEKKLTQTVARLFTDGRGILATDDRESSIGKRFDALQIENTVANRSSFRELLLKTSGIETFVAATIINEEILNQVDAAGTPLWQIPLSKGMLVILKLDKGLAKFDGEESVSVGLEDLDARLETARSCGVELSKWRSVFVVGAGYPTDVCIEKNAKILAEYTIKCQRKGIVPLPEPEILFDGDYSIDEMECAARRIYAGVFKEFANMNVFLPGVVLKISFLTHGCGSNRIATTQEIARKSVEMINTAVSGDIGGVVFLSGGHELRAAAGYLKTILSLEPHIKNISFSFNRALTAGPMEIWRGSSDNIEEARQSFLDNLAIAWDASRQ